MIGLSPLSYQRGSRRRRLFSKNNGKMESSHISAARKTRMVTSRLTVSPGATFSIGHLHKWRSLRLAWQKWKRCFYPTCKITNESPFLTTWNAGGFYLEPESSQRHPPA